MKGKNTVTIGPEVALGYREWLNIVQSPTGLAKCVHCRRVIEKGETRLDHSFPWRKQAHAITTRCYCQECGEKVLRQRIEELTELNVRLHMTKDQYNSKVQSFVQYEESALASELETTEVE